MGAKRPVQKILQRSRRRLTKGLPWDGGSGINRKAWI